MERIAWKSLQDKLQSTGDMVLVAVDMQSVWLFRIVQDTGAKLSAMSKLCKVLLYTLMHWCTVHCCIGVEYDAKLSVMLLWCKTML